MAEDMIERAARALYDCESVRAGHSAKIIAGIARGPRDVGIEPFEECADTSWRPDARHAILAALDPRPAEIHALARDAGVTFQDMVGVLMAFRRRAQGEQTVRSDMREKD